MAHHLLGGMTARCSFQPGALRPPEAELLLSYLTVPYLRVPLLLRFFAQPSHIHALGSVRLQAALDAALFEPGLWQAEAKKALPTQVPPATKSHDRVGVTLPPPRA